MFQDPVAVQRASLRGLLDPPRGAGAGGASDERLLERMAGGDHAAVAELYDRWAARVYQVARAVVGAPEDAEEVLGDVFWQAWREAERFDAARGSAGVWLGMIARSRALDLVRTRQRRADAREREWEPPAPGATHASPLADTEEKERGLMVRNALRSLPAEQSEAVRLAFFRGMSQSQIAEHLGQPLGTVKTRIRLAMAKLKAELAVLHGAIE